MNSFLFGFVILCPILAAEKNLKNGLPQRSPNEFDAAWSRINANLLPPQPAIPIPGAASESSKPTRSLQKPILENPRNITEQESEGRWWQGPSVCVRTKSKLKAIADAPEESRIKLTDDEDDDNDSPKRQFSGKTTICTSTSRGIRICRTSEIVNATTYREVTKKFKCCRGFKLVESQCGNVSEIVQPNLNKTNEEIPDETIEIESEENLLHESDESSPGILQQLLEKSLNSQKQVMDFQNAEKDEDFKSPPVVFSTNHSSKQHFQTRHSAQRKTLFKEGIPESSFESTRRDSHLSVVL